MILDVAPRRSPLVTDRADPASLVDIRAWRRGLADEQFARIEEISLDAVPGWSTGPGRATYGHESGKFFSVVGARVRSDEREVEFQPMIDQPEIGLLGIAITPDERGWAALVQAKAEPGNINGIQLSPTVQATRSNYRRVHKGRAVPYLDLFGDQADVVIDTRQSEHGDVFWRKRNRVMVVATARIEPLPGFRWVALADLLSLLHDDDLVHADTRAVLACLRWTIQIDSTPTPGAELVTALGVDLGAEAMRPISTWLSAERTASVSSVDFVALPEMEGWERSSRSLRRTDGHGFEIVAVTVDAGGREVSRWSQPMVRPTKIGLIGLVTSIIDGELCALLQLVSEPGLVDGAELGPTVQIAGGHRPRTRTEGELHDLVSSVGGESVLFDAILSDEGGRFLHGRHRHLVVAVDHHGIELSHRYRWCRIAELAGLLMHSHQVNMQARSALVCLMSTLCATP